MKPLAALGFEPAYARLDAAGADFDKYYSRMGGGTLLKTTRPGRFAELDALLVAELGRFAPGRLIRVHDVAASSAITSIELLETLRARGPANVRASDYYDALYILDGTPFSFVFDADMAPLQATVGRAGISAQHGPLRRVLAPFWASAIARQSEARRVSLFHPRALAAAASDTGFTLVRESFFAPEAGPYEVVRLLNALWPELGRDAIGTVLRAAIATMTEDGVLVLGRAGDYTLFGRSGECLKPLGGLGDPAQNVDLMRGIAALVD